MSTDTLPAKPGAFQKTANIILILINLNGTFATLSMATFYGLQVHERVIIALSSVLLTTVMVVKEFMVSTLIKRIYLNLLTLIGFILIYLFMYLAW